MSNRNDRWIKTNEIVMSDQNSFLGTGWGFPPTFTTENSGVGMTSGFEDIQASLDILLSTRLGERVMRPKYGCNLDVMVFEAMNTNMITYVKDLITNAIKIYEPRIKLESINLDTAREKEGVLLIELEYTVKSTNSRHNYVYPFYKNEGTNITK